VVAGRVGGVPGEQAHRSPPGGWGRPGFGQQASVDQAFPRLSLTTAISPQSVEESRPSHALPMLSNRPASDRAVATDSQDGLQYADPSLSLQETCSPTGLRQLLLQLSDGLDGGLDDLHIGVFVHGDRLPPQGVASAPCLVPGPRSQRAPQAPPSRRFSTMRRGQSNTPTLDHVCITTSIQDSTRRHGSTPTLLQARPGRMPVNTGSSAILAIGAAGVPVLQTYHVQGL